MNLLDLFGKSGEIFRKSSCEVAPACTLVDRPGILSLKPCGHDILYNICSISYISCWWWEEELSWFLVMGERSRSTLAFCLCNLADTLQSTFFAMSYFKTAHIDIDYEKRNPIEIGSRSTFGILSLKSCEHDTDYSFWPIFFKLHIKVNVDDERKNPIDKGQRSRSALAISTLFEALWALYA